MPRRDVDQKQPWRAIRMRTVTGVLAGFLIAAAIETAASVARALPGPHAIAPFAMLVALEIVLAALAFWASRRLLSIAERSIWLLVSLSLLAIASGDGLMAFVLGRGEALAPRLWLFVPSLLVEYAAVAGASALYARRLRARANLGRAGTEATIAVCAIGVAVWFGVLAPRFAAGGDNANLWVGVALAAGDLLGLVAPTLFVSLALLHDWGEDGIGRDWVRLQAWATVTVGFALASGSDILWYYMTPSAPLSSGSLVRFASAAGHVAVAAGAFLALDAEEARAADPVEAGDDSSASSERHSDMARAKRVKEPADADNGRATRPRADLATESLPWRVVRVRTVMTALGGLVAVALVQTTAGVSAWNGSELVALIASYAGVAIEFAVGSLVIALGLRMRERVSRRTWLFMGAAVVCAAVSDLDWTYRQGAPLQLATPPETGFVQAALVIAYSCGAVALIAYGLHWRHRSDVRVSALLTLGVMTVFGAGVWFGVLRPALRLTQIPPASSIGYLTYSIADIVFVLAPAVFVVLTLMRVPSPTGRVPDWVLLQPWATLALAGVLIAGSGLGWFYRAAVAPWAPGTLLDSFYLAGYVVFGVGVMLAADHEDFLGEELAGGAERSGPAVIRRSS